MDFFSSLDIKSNKTVNKLLDSFVDNLVCFVEFPYVDKYYRDSYYNFFSKKHQAHLRDSIRISFIQECDDITCTADLFNKSEDELRKIFLGFITVRPTSHRIVGRSFLSSKISKISENNSFVTCSCKTKIVIFGKNVEIDGFPYCPQDREVTSCSEVAILNLLEYYGNKYAEYSTILPSSIIKLLSKNKYSRQLPSSGLLTSEISYILKKLGFGSVVYSKKRHNDLREIIYTYVESGIPIIANVTDKSDNSGHSILVIGRKNIDRDIDSIPVKSENFVSIFNDLLIINDNEPPYRLCNFDNPIDDPSYSISSIIVPLHKKVHLDAKLFRSIINDVELLLNDKFYDDNGKELKFNLIPNSIPFKVKGSCSKVSYMRRSFLTTSNKYKSFIESSDIPVYLKTLILNKSMPKTVWVSEILEGPVIKSDKKNQRAFSIIIIDATESGYFGHLILAANEDYMIYYPEYYDKGKKRHDADKFRKKYEIIYVRNKEGEENKKIPIFAANLKEYGKNE